MTQESIQTSYAKLDASGQILIRFEQKAWAIAHGFD